MHGRLSLGATFGVVADVFQIPCTLVFLVLRGAFVIHLSSGLLAKPAALFVLVSVSSLVYT